MVMESDVRYLASLGRFQWGSLDRPMISHHEKCSDCVQCATQGPLRESGP